MAAPRRAGRGRRDLDQRHLDHERAAGHPVRAPELRHERLAGADPAERPRVGGLPQPRGGRPCRATARAPLDPPRRGPRSPGPGAARSAGVLRRDRRPAPRRARALSSRRTPNGSSPSISATAARPPVNKTPAPRRCGRGRGELTAAEETTPTAGRDGRCRDGGSSAGALDREERSATVPRGRASRWAPRPGLQFGPIETDPRRGRPVGPRRARREASPVREIGDGTADRDAAIREGKDAHLPRGASSPRPGQSRGP